MSQIKNMDNDNKIQSRKKFIGVGLTATALLTAFKFFIPVKKKKPETVKMLTREGVLVEVSADKVYNGTSRKINDTQLKNWVKKKQS
jgi:hypothetical protein